MVALCTHSFPTLVMITEIKQVSACSIQVCQGSMRINAWNTFVLRVEHPYIVRKFDKFLDMGELTFHTARL